MDYSDILFLPINMDLESAVPENFLEIWEQNADVVQRTGPCDRCRPDHPDCCYQRKTWKGLSIYGQFSEFQGKTEFHQPQLSEEKRKLFKPLIDCIFQQGPFERLDHVWLWQSLESVTPHVERNHSRHWDGPYIFRIMLYDENPQQTFFLKKWSGSQREKPTTINSEDAVDLEHQYIRLSKTPQAFAWNNYRCFHGSDYDPQYKKILICVAGYLSKIKHKNMIERSLKSNNQWAWIDHSGNS